MQPEINAPILFFLFLLPIFIFPKHFIFLSQETDIILIVRMLQHSFVIVTVFYKSPANQWIISEGLNDCDNGLLVGSEQFHNFFAGLFENTMNSTRLHCLDKHSGESERNFLRKFLSHLSDIETISKIDVNNLASIPLYHNIVWMSVAKADYVAHDGHDSKRTCKAWPRFKPFLAVAGSGPQDIFQVCAWYFLAYFLVNFHFLGNGERLVCRTDRIADFAFKVDLRWGSAFAD